MMQCTACRCLMLSLAQFLPRSYWCPNCGTIRLPGDTMKPQSVQAVVDERERCAKIAESYEYIDPEGFDEGSMQGREIARRIRQEPA